MSDAKVALGRRLFNDPQFSSTGNYSCASCHQRDKAYTDGRARGIGATGDAVRRSSMSLANVAYNLAFTWGDSRVRSLEAQMRTPLFNTHPVEMGVAQGGAQLAAINADPEYRRQFCDAFGGSEADHDAARDSSHRGIRTHVDLGTRCLRSLSVR